MQSQIRKIIVNEQEIIDPNIILNDESLLKIGDSNPPSQINNFLDKVQLPKLNITEINECDDELLKKIVYLLKEYAK